MSEAIRLLICDDHQLLTDAMSIMVDRDDGIELVAPPLADPADAVAAAIEHRPDIVLMDVVFEGRSMSGIDATRAITAAAPATTVLIVSAQDEDRLLIEAVEAGACGFLNKHETAAQILGQVRRAAAGETLIDPVVLTRALQEVARQRAEEDGAKRRLDELTPRERTVLIALAAGGSNGEIAAGMHVSPQTLQTHVHNILTKLGVRSRLEAVVFAVKNGAIEV